MGHTQQAGRQAGRQDTLRSASFSLSLLVPSLYVTVLLLGGTATASLSSSSPTFSIYLSLSVLSRSLSRIRSLGMLYFASAEDLWPKMRAPLSSAKLRINHTQMDCVVYGQHYCVASKRNRHARARGLCVRGRLKTIFPINVVVHTNRRTAAAAAADDLTVRAAVVPRAYARAQAQVQARRRLTYGCARARARALALAQLARAAPLHTLALVCVCLCVGTILHSNRPTDDTKIRTNQTTCSTGISNP